jgi:hypothetical protein
MPSLDFIIDFFNYISDWFHNGIYLFFVKLIVYWKIKMLILGWESKLAALELSYSIAQSFMASLNISSVVNSYLSNFPLSSVIYYLRIPELLNFLFSAYLTRVLFRLIG